MLAIAASLALAALLRAIAASSVLTALVQAIAASSVPAALLQAIAASFDVHHSHTVVVVLRLVDMGLALVGMELALVDTAFAPVLALALVVE